MTDPGQSDTELYKADQLELLGRAAELAAELHRVLQVDWLPDGWQEAACHLRECIERELRR